MSKICYGCFRQTADEYNICPYCRFDFRVTNTSSRVLRPGTILNNRYIVGKTLGEGGFGITYLVCDQYNWMKYAIKEYYPSNIAIRDTSVYGGNTLHISAGAQDMAYSEGLKRYVREAAILSRFSSLSGVVSVKDFFYENGTAYIVMEYIDGISLKEYMESKGGKLTVNETLNIMEPIIKSLAIIHQNNLLHRDISPDNIMISHDGKVKLIDFGAARYFSDDTEKSMTVVLKHGYAPIEQYSRKGEHGEWTDVYALCAVMYKMITGIVPDEATDRIKADGLIKITKLNKKVPKHVAAAIEKGLAVQPEDRYQDMMELYYDLYQTNEQLKESKKSRRNSVMIKLLVVAIVIVVIGSEVALMGYFKNHEGENTYSALDEEDDNNSGKKSKEEKEDDKEEIRKDEQSENEEEPGTVSSESSSDTSTGVNTVAETKNKEKGKLDIIKSHEEINQVESAQTSQEGSRAVVVVRDGYLNGKSEDYTVGNILDAYSDSSGVWSYASNSDGSYGVEYSATRNGTAYTIKFEVYTDDTFKVTGATENNSNVDKYTDYFQNILKQVGI